MAFASRSLSKPEMNYSQFEKEALSIVFGVRKFRQYLLGKSNFQIVTDHKPLIEIFDQDRPIFQLSSS